MLKQKVRQFNFDKNNGLDNQIEIIPMNETIKKSLKIPRR